MFQFSVTGNFENHSERKVRNVPVRDTSRDLSATYAQLLDALFAEFDNRKWKVLEKRYALYSNDQMMTAAFQLSVPGLNPKGLSVWLGVQMSLNRRTKLSFYAGCVDKPTGHGVVTSKLSCRRLTTAADLMNETPQYLDNWLRAAQKVEARVAVLKRMRLSETRYAALLLQVLRNESQPTKMAWSWGGFIDQFYRLQGDQTAWGLMLSLAEGASRGQPVRQMDMLLTARQIVTAEYKRLRPSKSGR